MDFLFLNEKGIELGFRVHPNPKKTLNPSYNWGPINLQNKSPSVLSCKSVPKGSKETPEIRVAGRLLKPIPSQTT
jgi:hypothetical protein